MITDAEQERIDELKDLKYELEFDGFEVETLLSMIGTASPAAGSTEGQNSTPTINNAAMTTPAQKP